MSAAPTTLATVKTEIVDRTAEAIRGYLSTGRLHLPANYSAENAIKSAWLILQEAVDKDKKPVLEVCTKASIANALMSMAIRGLNPAKTQCYFIAYGKTLVCQRSYFGDIALAQRVRPGIEVNAECYYEGDEIGYEMLNGKKVGVRHVQDIGNVDPSKLKGAYCVVTDENGVVLNCEVMTIDRIKKSWSMSKTYKPENKYGTHHDFPDDMAKRTVIRRTLKPIINSSSDELLLAAMAQSELDETDAEIAEAVAAEANGQLLSIESSPIEQEPEDEERIGNAPSDEESGGAPF